MIAVYVMDFCVMGREFIQCENRSFITCALLTSSPSIEGSGGEGGGGGGTSLL